MKPRLPSAPRVGTATAKPERLTRVASWGLSLALAGAAAAAPALAEGQVRRQLRERLGVDEGFTIDLDLGGLELRNVSRALPDERGHVRIAHLRVRPSHAGIVVELDGLDARIARSRRPGVTRTRVPNDADPGPSPALADPRDPIADLLIKLRGLPIEVVTHGQIRVDLGGGLRATALDPGLSLPGDGRVLARGRFDLGAGDRPDWASATVEIAAVDARPRELEFSGRLALADTDADLTLAGHAAGKRASVELHEPEGGRATLSFDREVEPGRDRLTLVAEALPLALLAPFADLLGQRAADALGERDGQLRLDGASVGGTVELTRGDGLTRARLDAVELRGLTIDSNLLAAEPVTFASLVLDGELTREQTPAGPRSSAQLTVDHGGVAIAIAGQLDAARVVFDVELPSTPCQAILDALPGAPAALAGTQLRGQLDAHFGVTLDFAALAQARARYLGPEAETLELDEFEAPGQLRFALPYLERCEVVRLGPGIDVDGLAGPYRHRFVTGSGAEKRRVMALGDADYVDLASVPKLALAFVILEDARYWKHDGFDREQIERAFWFNVLEGRVSRGASTITQQAARSLWLGVDRSLARKLAEAMLAAELERHLDKRRILELYLNVIELGPEVHGIAEAARYHFGKQPRELSLVEALHLASLAPAPVGYSRRFADGEIDEQWRAHLRQQIRRLRIRHLISADEAKRASAVRMQLREHPELRARPG
jgi:hypothetical protein